MIRVRKVLGTKGVLTCTLCLAGILAACGSSKSGIGAGAGGNKGVGGNAQGQGGAAQSGGAIGAGGRAGGGTGSTTTSTAGMKGAGGDGAGGVGAGGMVKGGSNGGSVSGAGGATKGGVGGGSLGGAGGAVKGGVDGGGVGGTGGMLEGGVDGGSVGGIGGMVKGGAGGSGGAPPLDGGSPDAPATKCSDITTRVDCDARDDCHSVFEDPGTCGCVTPGCCAHFKRCTDGGYASCMGPATCEMVQPFCDLPYVIAYEGLCYDGCVYQDDCGLLPCPQAAPKNGSACSSSNGTCYYEDCAGSGRSLATCVAGAWKVDSAACASFRCEAPNTEGGGLTCAAGQVCVVTTSTSFNVTPACVDQTCGTRSMSAACINGLTGNCSPKYNVSGVVVSCAERMP